MVRAAARPSHAKNLFSPPFLPTYILGLINREISLSALSFVSKNAFAREFEDFGFLISGFSTDTYEGTGVRVFARAEKLEREEERRKRAFLFSEIVDRGGING